MLHSGSRNVGHKTATYYSKLAKQLNEEWSWDLILDPKWDLAFLPLSGKNKKYGDAYLREMNWCLDFARSNRNFMTDLIKDAIATQFSDVVYEETIDVHHNYAQLENHFGENVIVHRKGATSARKDEYGLIPGSQGTSSYVVKGKGNPDSFCSCSHGAGRLMSRKKARNDLNLEEEKRKLDEKGIIHSIRNESDLDEAASAYKDIEDVMKYQDDLVSVETKLTPLAVMKG